MSVTVLLTGANKVFTSASGNHSFYLKTDGTLWGMGKNEFGQLADGSTTIPLSAVQVGKTVSLNVVGSGVVLGAGTYFTGRIFQYRQPLQQVIFLTVGLVIHPQVHPRLIFP